MPTLINIESTADEPIRFFLEYHHGGHKLLHNQYKAINEPNRYYDPQKGAVVTFVVRRIDEIESETTLEEYPLEDFIRNSFEEEMQKSIQLISEVYRSKGDSENAWAYKRLLKAFDKHYERLKNYPDYPEYELLPSSLMTIVKHAIKQYDQMYSFPLIAKAKRKLIAENAVNTGYVIKKEYRPRIMEFSRELISASFIDPNTEPEQWYAFFRGEFPQDKINWIVDRPDGHLWYFIQQIEESKILLEFPKQQWKYLDHIFTFKGNSLPPKFYDNHYLNKKGMKVLDHAFHILKS